MSPRKKQHRNISGLCNQPKQDSTPPAVVGASGDDSGDALIRSLHFDSMKVDWENEDESDMESEIDQDDFEDEEFDIRLLEMAEKGDSKALDWLPPRLRVLRTEQKARPQGYNTKPDAMNKALIPQLSTAWKAAMLQTSGSQHIPPPVNTNAEDYSDEDIQIFSAPPSPEVPAVHRASQSPEMSEEDLPPISEPVSTAVFDEEDIMLMSEPVSSAAASDTGDDFPEKQAPAQHVTEEQLTEAWEDELEENLASTVKGPPRDWEEIWKEVKAELKKNSKILPLSRINQLMDGGKQRKQHDTIIPMSNPYEEHRGKPQSMTNKDGQQKGLNSE
ncbi:hypothetical protein B0H19DRAFT_1083319 [Mycena capillaripes]|nr:hypothetical protein B0H19DRAFT_1083319 [Mycena capillaripes]